MLWQAPRLATKPAVASRGAVVCSRHSDPDPDAKPESDPGAEEVADEGVGAQTCAPQDDNAPELCHLQRRE